jgi:hypothetical protein
MHLLLPQFKNQHRLQLKHQLPQQSQLQNQLHQVQQSLPVLLVRLNQLHHLLALKNLLANKLQTMTFCQCCSNE